MAKRATKKQDVRGAAGKQGGSVPASGSAGGSAKAAQAKPATGRKARPRRSVPEPVVVLTHDQIAERAYLIWQANGGGPGRDPQNWAEAENQLRREHGVA